MNGVHSCDVETESLHYEGGHCVAYVSVDDLCSGERLVVVHFTSLFSVCSKVELQ